MENWTINRNIAKNFFPLAYKQKLLQKTVKNQEKQGFAIVIIVKKNPSKIAFYIWSLIWKSY